MKKFLLPILIIIVFLCLLGCGAEETPAMGDLHWKMTSIQENSNGRIYWVGSPSMQETYPDADIMNMTCNLSGTEITLCDHDGGSIWRGVCKQMERENPQTTTYEITFDDTTKGPVVRSVTKYMDAEQEGTLVVSANGYTIYFSAEMPGR